MLRSRSCPSSFPFRSPAVSLVLLVLTGGAFVVPLVAGAGPATPVAESPHQDTSDAGAEFRKLTLRGEIRRMTDILADRGLTADSDPIADQVALVTEDGAVHPLLSDTAARALFVDERLRDRPAELVARRYSGLPYLKVLTVRVEARDAFDTPGSEAYRIPEYYCDICTISVRYPQACPCCQGDMVLRMKPEGP